MTRETIFFNQVFDKKRLKVLIAWVLEEFGEKQALRVVEELKKIGFSNATQAGLSIGVADLSTPIQKASLISRAEYTMMICDGDFNAGRITATERSQRIVDTWHRVSETLRKQVVDHFSTYDQLNPVYIMALSGARGNFSQVRQLVGMRGLMADPQGQIISFPIRSNLREGLTLTEYFISCSGARKGLVDTALRTADTGYLTRRLVDVAHHIVIKKVDCNTNKGLFVRALKSENKTLLSLCDRLVGRVLAQDIEYLLNQHNHLLAQKNQEICATLASQIQGVQEQVLIRSPLTCALPHSVCQLCYGWSLSQGGLVSLGEAVGVIAAQSIGEPGTQLTMRTFHTGGVFSGDLLHEIRAPHSGKIEFSKAFQGLMIRTTDGQIAFLTKTSGEILLEDNKIHDQAINTRVVKQSETTPKKGGATQNGDTVDTHDDIRWWSNNKVLQPFFLAKSVAKASLLQRVLYLPSYNTGALSHQGDALITSVPKVLSVAKLTITRNLIARYKFRRKPSEKYKDFFVSFFNPRQNSRNKELPIRLAIFIANLQRKNVLLPKGNSPTGFYNKNQNILLNKIIRSCLLYEYNEIRNNTIQTTSENIDPGKPASKQTCLQFQALSLLFVRQSEYVRKNQLLAQISLFGEEGNQPIKTRQTIFAELSGKVFETQGAVNNKKFIKNIKKTSRNSETDISEYDIGDALKARAFDSIPPEKSTKLGFFHVLATQIGATFDFNRFQSPFYARNSIPEISHFDVVDQNKMLGNNKVVPRFSGTERKNTKRSLNKRTLFFAFDRAQSPEQTHSQIDISRDISIFDQFLYPSKRQVGAEPLTLDSSEPQGQTNNTFTRKSLELKCAYNPYTAQFFSSTKNKNVVASLVKTRIHKVKKGKSLPQTTLYKKFSKPVKNQLHADPLYLRTIAQEGDLVDSSYKNYLSSS